ncbi:MAG TPA: hypothetical protein VIV55_00355 [Flavobacterium sp.]
MQIKIRKIQHLLVCIIGISFSTFGQDSASKITLTSEELQSLYDKEGETKKWLNDLKTPGVKIDKDKMVFNDETQKLINNPEYLKEIYKDKYSFVDVKESLINHNIKLAFWQMINIYPENKELILKYIVSFDKLVPADEIVVSSFYTYAFFDPKITKLTSGKPEVYRPDLFEEYLRRTKEIVTYIAYIRAEAEKAKK